MRLSVSRKVVDVLGAPGDRERLVDIGRRPRPARTAFSRSILTLISWIFGLAFEVAHLTPAPGLWRRHGQQLVARALVQRVVAEAGTGPAIRSRSRRRCPGHGSAAGRMVVIIGFLVMRLKWRDDAVAQARQRSGRRRCAALQSFRRRNSWPWFWPRPASLVAVDHEGSFHGGPIRSWVRKYWSTRSRMAPVRACVRAHRRLHLDEDDSPDLHSAGTRSASFMNITSITMATTAPGRLASSGPSARRPLFTPCTYWSRPLVESAVEPAEETFLACSWSSAAAGFNKVHAQRRRQRQRHEHREQHRNRQW